MNKILLPVKRPFNVRAYLVLVGLLFFAVYAIYPYLLTKSGTATPGMLDLALSGGIDLLINAALGAAGVWLASRTGLGMPFIEGWAKRVPIWNRLRGVIGLSILAAIFLILFKGLDVAFAALMMRISAAPPQAAANEIIPPFWQGFLAAFSAGMTEEVIFRLFGLTLLAWLGTLLFHSLSGRPAPWLLWTANILFAILFGAVHLISASQMGIQLDPITILRTLLVNGAGGIVFGWLYWSYGLESAILAHMAADFIRHGLIPLVTQQADPTWSIAIGAIIGLVVVIAALWSVWAIRRDREQYASASEPGAPRNRADYSHRAV